MNAIDRKLATILKALAKSQAGSPAREKASVDFREARRRIGDSGPVTLLDEIHGDVTGKTENPSVASATDPERDIRELRDCGFPETAAWLFIRRQRLLVDFALDQVLQFAPNAVSLEAQRKSSRTSADEFEKQLLERMPETYSTAGAEWLLQRGRPDRLDPLLSCFLKRQSRPKFLNGWADALTEALKRDKRGLLLGALLRTSNSDAEMIEAAAEVVRVDAALLKACLERLPQILGRKGPASVPIDFVRRLFGIVVESHGREREIITALLARLGASLVLVDKRTEEIESILDFSCSSCHLTGPRFRPTLPLWRNRAFTLARRVGSTKVGSISSTLRHGTSIGAR